MIKVYWGLIMAFVILTYILYKFIMNAEDMKDG